MGTSWQEALFGGVLFMPGFDSLDFFAVSSLNRAPMGVPEVGNINSDIKYHLLKIVRSHRI
jgi:hypothetical protein